MSRPIIPEELKKELESFVPYLEADVVNKRYVVRKDAPEGMAERYEELCKILHEMTPK